MEAAPARAASAVSNIWTLALKDTMKPKLKIVQIRSGIGRTEHQNKILKGLGLRGPNSAVVVENTPAFRGMVKKILHLVAVEETNG